MFDFLLELLSNEIFFKFFIAANLLALFIALSMFFTDNCSWSERLWGITPPAFAWAFFYTSLYKYIGASWTFASLYDAMYKNSTNSPLRLFVMAMLMTVWGVRLTYVFYRRGYFNPASEDHRWQYLRSQFNYPANRFTFKALFSFVAVMQNWLLLGLATPMWFIQNNASSPFNRMDAILTLAWLGFFLIEFVADEQQYTFQDKKAHYKAFPGKTSQIGYNFTANEISDIKRGFNIRGLFAYSRHPNYFGELGMWWTMYLFTLSSQLLTSSWRWTSLFNYSMLGPLFLTFVFRVTSKLTEKVSKEKYPDYAVYQSKVCEIVPHLCANYQPPPESDKNE